MGTVLRRLLTAMAAVAVLCHNVTAQAAQAPSVTGRVTDASTREPITGALVAIEGTAVRSLSAENGRYRLIGVPAGPQVIIVRRIGFAPARVPVTVPASGSLEQDVALARASLMLPEIVAADPTGRPVHEGLITTA